MSENERKNAGGRPLKYETPEQMQIEIDKYFDSIDAHNKKMITQQTLTLMRPYTITGLALAIDLTRQGLIEYSDKSDEFSDTVGKAKGRVELFNEEQLYRSSQVTGVIFNLKNNFRWKDEQERKHSGTVALGAILEELDGGSSDLPSDKG